MTKPAPQSAANDKMSGLDRLKVAAAEAEVVLNRMIAAGLRRKNAELEAKLAASHAEARRDSLSGLTNRRGKSESVEELFRETMQDNIVALEKGEKDKLQSLVMLAFDIDNFKTINDRFGHGVGDEAIMALADGIRHIFRRSDDVVALRNEAILGRNGGDEFIVAFACPRAEAHEAAQQMAERLRSHVEAQCRLTDHPEHQITTSIGAAILTPEARHAPHVARVIAGLEKRADHAANAAKEAGRNRVYIAGARGAEFVAEPSPLNPADAPTIPSTRGASPQGPARDPR